MLRTIYLKISLKFFDGTQLLQVTNAITDDDGGDFDGGTNTNGMVEENETFSSVSPNSSSMEDAPAIRICGCNITLFIFILNIWMYVKSICLLNINN